MTFPLAVAAPERVGCRQPLRDDEQTVQADSFRANAYGLQAVLSSVPVDEAMEERIDGVTKFLRIRVEWLGAMELPGLGFRTLCRNGRPTFLRCDGLRTLNGREPARASSPGGAVFTAGAVPPF